jgi:hypothetical protein
LVAFFQSGVENKGGKWGGGLIRVVPHGGSEGGGLRHARQRRATGGGALVPAGSEDSGGRWGADTRAGTVTGSSEFDSNSNFKRI